MEIECGVRALIRNNAEAIARFKFLMTTNLSAMFALDKEARMHIQLDTFDTHRHVKAIEQAVLP
jgi:hypothetical protein